MFISYETTRLILKPLNREAAAMVLSFYEENKSAFEPWEPKRSDCFYTLPYQKASLSAEYHQMLEGKLLRFWVFLKDNPDKIIGSFCFQNFLKGPFQSCSLGYKFSQKYQHRGYALESIQKGIDILMDEWNIHRIEAFIMQNNYPSINLINRLGFIYEGISYSYANINGKWTNHLRYALINPRDIKPFDLFNPDLNGFM